MIKSSTNTTTATTTPNTQMMNTFMSRSAIAFIEDVWKTLIWIKIKKEVCKKEELFLKDDDIAKI